MLKFSKAESDSVIAALDSIMKAYPAIFKLKIKEAVSTAVQDERPTFNKYYSNDQLFLSATQIINMLIELNFSLQKKFPEITSREQRTELCKYYASGDGHTVAWSLLKYLDDNFESIWAMLQPSDYDTSLVLIGQLNKLAWDALYQIPSANEEFMYAVRNIADLLERPDLNFITKSKLLTNNNVLVQALHLLKKCSNLHTNNSNEFIYNKRAIMPLIEFLATTPLVDENGCTCLMWAAQNGKTRAVEALLNIPDIEISKVDRYGQSAMTHALQKCKTAVADLIEKYSKQYNRPYDRPYDRQMTIVECNDDNFHDIRPIKLLNDTRLELSYFLQSNHINPQFASFRVFQDSNVFVKDLNENQIYSFSVETILHFKQPQAQSNKSYSPI